MLTRAGSPRTLLAGSWANFPNAENSLANVQAAKEAGTGVLSPVRPTLAPSLGPQHLGGRDADPDPAGPRPGSTASDWRQCKDLRGWKQKSSYRSDGGFETVFLSSEMRADSSVHPLLGAAPNTSYINGVVAFVVDLFPACRARVSILEGISEALAAEDVATLCRNNETPILHNLENRSDEEQPSRVPLSWCSSCPQRIPR